MIAVDDELCTGCGRCEPLCPEEALKAWGRLSVDDARCTDCLICIENCPVSALSAGE
ncbi:ATP-binding protein [Chloroflexota bacterium]